MLQSVRRHWPEYLMEAAGLGLFMISACAFATLLFHPASPAFAWIPSGGARRLLMGLAMGATCVMIVYSPWGRRSGAHLNPAFTLAFLRLGKVAPADAAWYVAAQAAGGLLGVVIVIPMLGAWLAAPEINYVATVPGAGGVSLAFLTEFGMSAGMMGVVLAVSNSRLMRWTGACAGALVAGYIGLLSPLSGMSMNPARTTASALPSGVWTAWWVYLLAPLLGMLLSAEVYVRVRGRKAVWCAKLDHAPNMRCIFCEHQRRVAPATIRESGECNRRAGLASKSLNGATRDASWMRR